MSGFVNGSAGVYLGSPDTPGNLDTIAATGPAGPATVAATPVTQRVANETQRDSAIAAVDGTTAAGACEIDITARGGGTGPGGGLLFGKSATVTLCFQLEPRGLERVR